MIVQDTARPVAGCPPGGSGYRNDADRADGLIAVNNSGQGWWSQCDVAQSVRKGDVISFDAYNQEVTSPVSKVVAARNDQDTSACVVTPASSGSALHVRRFLVEECEALQGLPRGHTAITWRGKPAPDGPRYRAIGNAMAVPVVRWILRRIDEPA